MGQQWQFQTSPPSLTSPIPHNNAFITRSWAQKPNGVGGGGRHIPMLSAGFEDSLGGDATEHVSKHTSLASRDLGGFGVRCRSSQDIQVHIVYFLCLWTTSAAAVRSCRKRPENLPSLLPDCPGLEFPWAALLQLLPVSVPEIIFTE